MNPTQNKLKFEQLTSSKKIPFDLLQLADPSVDHINDYLETGLCYLAMLGSETIGVKVLYITNCKGLHK